MTIHFFRNSVAQVSCLLIVSLHSAMYHFAHAEDWTQFRGSHAAGISQDTSVPVTWSESRSLKWKCDLPGPGSSSPIVCKDRVFLTCYSGYGVGQSRSGEMKDLVRHIVCIDRKTGQILWSKTITSEQPEDGYQGYISEHGYASNTPVTDGERVYCFFGKSGVIAFDWNGRQLWKTPVGKESSNRKWGSAASLILYKNMVIVNASEESQSVRGLDQLTGKEIWKATGSALELAYGTPLLVETKDHRTDLAIAAPGEIWGLNPDTGKLTWFAEHSLTGNICPSLIANGSTLYVFGGFRSSGSFAIEAGGKGDVKSQIRWTGRNSSYVATPVLQGKHLFWIDDRGQAFCIAAETGELAYRERVAEITSGGRPVYASPVAANGKIYVTTRWNGVLVLPAKPEFKVLNHNVIKGDESDFNATPAISDNQLFIRSNKALYCIAN